MYNVEQGPFLNGVVQVQTDLPAQGLLQTLKTIEVDLGRNLSAARNSPRPIDLDIITYDTHTIVDPSVDLTIPHQRLSERQFVLRPLCDIDPTLHIPQHKAFKAESKSQSGSGTNTGTPMTDVGGVCAGSTAQDLLKELHEREGDVGLLRVTPLRSGRLLRWGERTLLMGVVNVTPDSFSDGGRFNSKESALRQAELFLKHGFDLIDVRKRLFRLSLPSTLRTRQCD